MTNNEGSVRATAIQAGDCVTHKDGRTGIAASDEYTSAAHDQAVRVWWDNAKISTASTVQVSKLRS
jgi:hypothetical protein